MLTIALLRWPSMARYMRAEVFKMKESNYIKAAQILNVPSCADTAQTYRSVCLQAGDDLLYIWCILCDTCGIIAFIFRNWFTNRRNQLGPAAGTVKKSL